MTRAEDHALHLALDALALSPQCCPYHGQDFDKLGREPWGPPRCDSCKLPWHVSRALIAVSAVLVADAQAANRDH